MKTKIITTIGPSTWRTPTIKSLDKNGMSVGRLNSSYANKSELVRVRNLLYKVNPLITTMIDTVGLEIKLDKNNPEISLKKGETIKISSNPTKDNVLGVDYKYFEKDIKPGDKIIIDYGLIQLSVVSKEEKSVTAKALHACTIKKGKTVTLPDTELSQDEPVSEIDRNNIQNALEAGYDYINISYVRSIQDIRAIRQYIGTAKISLIAKIENAAGIQSVNEILPYVDGIMIPRKELSVESPFENLSIIQKELSIKSAQFGKPVIFSSEFLDSMKANRFPLKSEISDLGNAVFDRVDAVILTQETAIGTHPVLTTQTAQKIINRAEDSFELNPLFPDEFIVESALQTARNPKTKPALEKALQKNFSVVNVQKFTCQYGLDAFKTMQEFWYEYEPLIYLSKLRKPINITFESPDARAIRQVNLLYGVEGILK